MKETIRALRAECSSLKKKLAAAEPSSSSSTSAAAAAVAAVPAGGHGGGSPVDDYVNTSILHLVISRGGWLIGARSSTHPECSESPNDSWIFVSVLQNSFPLGSWPWKPNRGS